MAKRHRKTTLSYLFPHFWSSWFKSFRISITQQICIPQPYQPLTKENSRTICCSNGLNIQLETTCHSYSVRFPAIAEIQAKILETLKPNWDKFKEILPPPPHKRHPNRDTPLVSSVLHRTRSTNAPVWKDLRNVDKSSSTDKKTVLSKFISQINDQDTGTSTQFQRSQYQIKSSCQLSTNFPKNFSPLCKLFRHQWR